MSLTYKDSGVDKEAGYKQVGLIKDMIKRTHVEGVLSDIGGFAGLFQLDTKSFKEPVLVSGTDGVGTKLRLAFMMDIHNTIGEDCVAMCVNDILCQGAKPLFFLDYIATGKLLPEKMASIVEGVSNGCIKASCGLIGGETAEMPGFYQEGEYDVAGFAVGVVDKDNIIDGREIKAGDYLIGLPSSGVHSNGFSLIRKIVFDKMSIAVDEYIEELGMTIGQELLKATRIYVKPVYDLIEKFHIKGLCHITGGGFYENIPRMLPEGLQANIDTSRISTPMIFKLLMKWGNVDIEEMYSSFNMGIGMVMAIDSSDLKALEIHLKEIDEDYVVLGRVEAGDRGVVLCHQ